MPEVLDTPQAPVQPPSTAPEAKPLPAPKVSSQFAKSIERMNEMLGDDKPVTPAKPEPSKPEAKPTKPVPAKSQEPAKTPQEPVSKPQEQAKPDQEPLETPAGEIKVEGKGLGQIVNRQRKQLKELTTELETLRSQASRLSEVESMQKKVEAAEKRRQELEEHIRYVDYTKSEEYLTKYQKPFEDAMSRAVRDIEQLSVFTDDQGNTRKATAQDLMALTQMPLSKMDETAEAWFGKSAARVIRHVERIRDMVDTQERALEDARKNGEERARQTALQQSTAREQTSKLWIQFNTEDSNKYDFLKDKPEDEEWNGLLNHARDLADKAFSTYPGDPKLTPDQRTEAVRNMVAIRNRAIGFTTQKLRAERAEALATKLQKELDAIKSSAPTGGNGKSANGTGVGKPSSTMESALQGIDRLGQ